MGVERKEGGRIGPDWIGKERTGMDWSGMERTGLERKGDKL